MLGFFLQYRKPKMTSSTSGSSRSSGSICATSSCIFRFVVIRDVPSISKIDGDGPIAVWLATVGLDVETGGPDMDGKVPFVGVLVAGLLLLARDARADDVSRAEVRTNEGDWGEEGVPATASCITCWCSFGPLCAWVYYKKRSWKI